MNPQAPKDVYFTFAGPIDQQAVGRIFTTLNLAVNNRVEAVHLLVQSIGGIVDDGIAIYNYLANLPLRVITYNEGSVQSIGVLLYLAGTLRKCAANASFLIHKTTFAFQSAATAEMMRGRADAAELCDQRTDDILRSHIKMAESKWTSRDKFDLTITAQEAKEYGLIHEIAHFVPPRGGPIYNI